MQQNPIKLHLCRQIPGVSWIPILAGDLGTQKKGALFQDIDPVLYRGIWRLVSSPEDADYFLIPHGYSRIRHNQEYIEECVAYAKLHNKKILLFAYQDSHEPISIPRTIVFRSSQYKSSLRPYEIIMPAFIEDAGVQCGVNLKNKGDAPVVGFVGKAGFEGVVHALKYFIKSIFTKHPYKNGLYYRRKAIRSILRDKILEAHFIIRSSYSGNIKSISLDPQTARREYIDNMIASDFALTVKGDGNYSLRFYEAMSLGRIPLFVDTDSVLPLENMIPYDDFIVRVSYRDIDTISRTALDMYRSWSPKEYEHRQVLARELFEKYLYMPAFLRHVLVLEFLEKYNTHTI